MALLGSFIDTRIKTWHINRKSFTFKHGLPQKPDFIVILGLGLNRKYLKFGFESDEKKVKIYGSYISKIKKKLVVRVISVVVHSIIK